MLFNCYRYWKKLRRGKFTQNTRKRKHLQEVKPGLPLCTHSHTTKYMDQSGQQVAVVHQYELPNGSLGAGQKPDPKMLLFRGVVYIIEAPGVQAEPLDVSLWIRLRLTLCHTLRRLLRQR